MMPRAPSPPTEERYDLDADLGDLDWESCESLVALGSCWSRRNQQERTARLRAETAEFFSDAPELEALKSHTLAQVLALAVERGELEPETHVCPNTAWGMACDCEPSTKKTG
jgi:hypothetical protein